MCPKFALCPLRSGGLTLEEATAACQQSAPPNSINYPQLAQETGRTATDFQWKSVSKWPHAAAALSGRNVNEISPNEMKMTGTRHPFGRRGEGIDLTVAQTLMEPIVIQPSRDNRKAYVAFLAAQRGLVALRTEVRGRGCLAGFFRRRGVWQAGSQLPVLRVCLHKLKKAFHELVATVCLSNRDLCSHTTTDSKQSCGRGTCPSVYRCFSEQGKPKPVPMNGWSLVYYEAALGL